MIMPWVNGSDPLIQTPVGFAPEPLRGKITPSIIVHGREDPDLWPRGDSRLVEVSAKLQDPCYFHNLSGL